ncbi:hypothetical protein ACF07V_34695 [Streptomyces sp. NPDC015661]|uniref:hypothetical protein n=1 Tax=Streptomyces sp. NPDC015661 TaxID=3364961 RepID=UPI00370185CB
MRTYIWIGVEEGARLVTGARRSPRGGVWSADEGHALDGAGPPGARSLRTGTGTGTTTVNGAAVAFDGQFDGQFDGPFGGLFDGLFDGVEVSGISREYGAAVLGRYTAYKTVTV